MARSPLPKNLTPPRPFAYHLPSLGKILRVPTSISSAPVTPCDCTTGIVLCHQPPSLVKVKVPTLDIAPLRSQSPPQKRSGMTRILEEFHSFTCTFTRSSAIGVSHTCLCLPMYIAGTHLPTPEGWKAEQTLVRSSAGRVANLQPPDCKSGTLPLSH